MKKDKFKDKRLDSAQLNNVAGGFGITGIVQEDGQTIKFDIPITGDTSQNLKNSGKFSVICIHCSTVTEITPNMLPACSKCKSPDVKPIMA